MKATSTPTLAPKPSLGNHSRFLTCLSLGILLILPSLPCQLEHWAGSPGPAFCHRLFEGRCLWHPAAEAWFHAPSRLGCCQLPAVEFGRQLQGCGACSRTASPLRAWLQDGRPGWLSTNREMKNLSGKVLPPFRSHWETLAASQQFFLFLSPLGREECHPKYCALTWEGLGAFGQSKKNEKNIDPPGVRARWIVMEYFKMC